MKRLPVLLAGLMTAQVFAADKPPLSIEQTIALAGVKGRFDHLALDLKTRRLFVAASENNTLEVVDLAAGKPLQSIKGMSKPTGVLFLPQTNRVLVSNGDDATIQILDASTFKHVKTLYSLLDPDNLRCDPQSGQAWVGYTDGALGIIDKDLTTLDRSFKMPGHPESFQIEKNGGRVFVNVPRAKGVAVLDRNKRKVVETWGLGDYEQNYPMALDEANGRLFVGCRKPAGVVVLDTGNGKLVASVPIAGDADDLFYDLKRKRIYVSCGEGFIDCIQLTSADQYQRLPTLDTVEGARTSLFSPELDRFYLAVPGGSNRAAEIRAYRPD